MATVMTRSFMFMFLQLCFCFLSCEAALSFSFNQGQELRDSDDSDHLISADGYFKLGFFHPGASSPLGQSSNTYLGIWYGKLPNNPEAVWVANPEDPIHDSSGVFTLDYDGKLKITRNGGLPIVLNREQNVTGNVTATLLNSGNLVLRELAANGTSGQVLWQSFDHPTNAFLPGMRLGMNLRTGQNLTLFSWLSDQVPSPGAFRLGVDPGGVDQLVVWRREDVYWRSGVWRNGSFENALKLTSRPDLFEFSFESNEEEKYFVFSVKSDSVHSRWELNSWGQILEFILDSDGTSWDNATIASQCQLYVNYTDAVCLEQKPTTCKNSSEIFVPIRGYLRETTAVDADFNPNLSLSDCHATCWNNCSCVSYESVHSNGTGCLFLSKASDFVRNDNFGFSYVLTLKNTRERRHSRGTNRRRWWIWFIIAIVVSSTVLFLGCFLYKRRKMRLLQQKETSQHNTSQDQALLHLRSQIPLSGACDIEHLRRAKKSQDYELFSFSDIMAATDNFATANKLGEGGFGPVYKGVFPDGKQIAVKRLASYSGQGTEEFMNEITLIAGLQHTNLVRLFGCCIQGEEKMLIYEYMPNRSLDSFLFDPVLGKALDWEKRINIIEGIAQGLLYLHRYSRLRVIHRDLKASNILLDQDMNPKISDFGMARIFGQDESRANTRRVVGTYGYMSPEYAMNGIFSVKSDVYSFGVLLLEIVSGKKNTVFSSSGALSLIELAWDLWKKGETHELMDDTLEIPCPKDQVLKFVHVGLLCVQEHAIDRPTMSDVISMFSNDSMFLPDPKQPAYSVSKSEFESSGLDFASVNSVSMTVMEAR